ncbi:RNA-directed DNA polymerase, eukaryota, Reverse transcriptase zinc-binding domain protein [Artemisia annua]|uniref:RNA-directed DNA polymerase, eukaryota, Reverse transcriptase zinc-binding domain protein n=1 Tax=Artemisia annua TaxID=35608 RepID=A0A2U1PAI6_ARTAN|nr:RNA-directed DNA polymerase, eukaryota, Reverse transcriptase zinc-binding domain protein [Artemisia annua]
MASKWVHISNSKESVATEHPKNSSWDWRKLLAIRPKVRPFIWHNINNGKNTSTWFDMWSDLSPLRDMLTPREIVRAGLSLKDSVYDVIENSNWKWPADWLPKYSTLFTLPLVTFKFKKLTLRSLSMLDSWKIPSACLIHEGSASCAMDSELAMKVRKNS